jgi:serine/threonine protein phosphatase 1
MISASNLSALSHKSAGPRGHRAYVVGDIHGRLDLLEQLLCMIESDVHTRPKSENVVVFLGDLIDRGPSSAQVVERLRLYQPTFGRTAFIKGNHEEVMLRVLRGEGQLLKQWVKFGGAECIRSYGLDPAALVHLPSRQAVRALLKAVPDAHLRFLRTFIDSFAFGSYLFVHAGIRPGVPVRDQSEVDLRWIRQPFLEDASDHGFIIVHGHTITGEPDVRSNRIGLDTGAYMSGVLTALRIDGHDRGFLQAVARELSDQT